MSNVPAPGFITASAAKQIVVRPISIHELKSVEAAKRLSKELTSGRIVPLARTRSSGEVIEVIAFAAPEEALAARAMHSSNSFEWRRFRRHPREAAETARLLQRALEISGLENDDGEETGFFVVPDDSEALFSNIEEDREAAKVMALRRLAEGVEELVRLLRPRISANA